MGMNFIGVLPISLTIIRTPLWNHYVRLWLNADVFTALANGPLLAKRGHDHLTSVGAAPHYFGSPKNIYLSDLLRLGVSSRSGILSVLRTQASALYFRLKLRDMEGYPLRLICAGHFAPRFLRVTIRLFHHCDTSLTDQGACHWYIYLVIENNGGRHWTLTSEPRDVNAVFFQLS